MDMDLLSIQPHQVSRDLRGYSVLLYGEPKTGKTTVATHFPKHLIAAFEKGYSAIPGAMARPLNTWGEFKRMLGQLKKSQVKDKFATIIIDTADLAYDACEQYILTNYNVAQLSDLYYGQGYNLVAKEFDDALQTIVRLGYGLVLISHSQDKTFLFPKKPEDNYTQIVPTLGNKARLVCSRLCDIVAYAKSIEKEGETRPYLFLRGTPRFLAGSRFKYMQDCIPFDYESLVEAINQAIDKEREQTGAEFFTNDRKNCYTPITELNFTKLKEEFYAIVDKLGNNPQHFQTYYVPCIQKIIEKYFRKGQTIANCSADQVEALSLIVDEVRELVANNENESK